MVFKDLPNGAEREIFQRVQLGVSLTSAGRISVAGSAAIVINLPRSQRNYRQLLLPGQSKVFLVMICLRLIVPGFVCLVGSVLSCRHGSTLTED